MDDAQDPCGHGKDAMGEKPRDPQEGRKTLQCWRCGGSHLRRICPHGEGCVRLAYNIQGHGTKAVEKWEPKSSPNDTTAIRSLKEDLQDRKEENKRLVKALVEKNQLNTVLLQSLEEFRRKIKI